MANLGQNPSIIAIPVESGGHKVVNLSPPSAPSTSGSFTGTKLTVLGWVVFLLALYGLNHTGLGHEFIYLSLVLIVLFLFLVNYKTVLGLLTHN